MIDDEESQMHEADFEREQNKMLRPVMGKAGHRLALCGLPRGISTSAQCSGLRRSVDKKFMGFF